MMCNLVAATQPRTTFPRDQLAESPSDTVNLLGKVWCLFTVLLETQLSVRRGISHLGFQCFQSNYSMAEQFMCSLLSFPPSCILNDVEHKLYFSAYHPF